MAEQKELLAVILGHHALLSMQEVLSRLNNDVEIVLADRDFLIFRGDRKQLLSQIDYMGGIQKIVQVFGTTNREHLFQEVYEQMVHPLAAGSDRKVKYSVSSYGSYKQYQRDLLLFLKRSLQQDRLPARFIHRKLGRNVMSIQLITERILEKGIDVAVMTKGRDMYYGKTLWVQDIEGYTRRDTHKPVRDMSTGMLPPKLAQVMISLVQPKHNDVLWDPFCGSGVLLMEAMNQGLSFLGSDISSDMVEKSKKNLMWYADEIGSSSAIRVVRHDATEGMMPESANATVIVTEGYLGTNFTEQPTKEQSNAQLEEVSLLNLSFILGLERTGYRGKVLMAMPWYGSYGYATRCTTFIQKVKQMGAKILPLAEEHLLGQCENLVLAPFTKEGTILYQRKQQFVGREIVLLQVG